MHGKHMKKAPRFLVIRGVAIAILVLALSVSSFATVMANTVSANVIDGDESYSFSMNSTDLDEILAQAQTLGLEPLGPLDIAERIENTTTVNIRRGVQIAVTEAGETQQLVGYKGDTLEKTLTDNSIVLKADDQITPSAETVIDTPLDVEIRRSCEVTVNADGKATKVKLIGGTVADALKEAKVTLNEKDTVNYEEDEALFDRMNIRVLRVTKIQVTADGETKEYEVSADSVEEALKKCKIDLGKDDRLNVDRKDKLTAGMEITIQRVETKEETVTEEIEYSTEYTYSDDMYEDESTVQSAGVNGQKEVTYKITYVDGEEEGREALSEKVLKEPVSAVVLQGTISRPSSSVSVSGGNGTGVSAGTFVDMYGNTVSYSNVMVGECTAYSVPGGTTSLGWDAVYGVVAVNPNVIPYGTKMYITSPDGSVVYGYGVAGDTGGAVMSGRIIADLCYNTVAECSIIGRRDMVVYILS